MQLADAIVIDNGSGMCKMGIGGEDYPKIRFYSVIGRSLSKNKLFKKIHSVGQQVFKHSAQYSITSPFDRDIITNWDDMTKIWEYGFSQLKVDQSKYACLLTEPFQTPLAQRQKITEIMFEHFNVSKFYLQKCPKLSMYSFGYTTAFTIDCGHSLTQFCPFYEGSYIPYAVQVVDFGGVDVNRYLTKLLKQINIKIDESELKILDQFKKNYCYVAGDYDAEISKPKQSMNKCIYELPDGKKVTFTDQRFKCPQLYFDPSIVGRKVSGLHENVFKIIKSCPLNLQPQFYKYILMCGGSSLFTGLALRLSKELDQLVPSVPKKIKAPEDGQNRVWTGGSVQVSLSTFQTQYITKQEYKEEGPSIVQKKCSN